MQTSDKAKMVYVVSSGIDRVLHCVCTNKQRAEEIADDCYRGASEEVELDESEPIGNILKLSSIEILETAN